MPDVDQLEAAVVAEYKGKLRKTRGPAGHVLVLGHSSAGKSTTAEAAAEKRGYRYIYDPALLETARFAHYTKQLFTHNDSQAFLPYEVEALIIRFLQNRSPQTNWICDQGIHSIWAYARARHVLGELDAHAYQTIYALFLTLAAESPIPRLVVRFRCDAAEARRRVEGRGRRHEATSLTAPFLEELDRAYSHVVTDFPSGVATEVIDTTGLDKSAALDRFLAIIDAHTVT